jgi:hypothetical protein
MALRLADYPAAHVIDGGVESYSKHEGSVEDLVSLRFASLLNLEGHPLGAGAGGWGRRRKGAASVGACEGDPTPSCLTAVRRT